MWYCTVHTLTGRVPGLKMGKTIGTVLLTPGADSTSTGSTLMTLGRPVGRSLVAGGWPPGFPPPLLAWRGWGGLPQTVGGEPWRRPEAPLVCFQMSEFLQWKLGWWNLPQCKNFVKVLENTCILGKPMGARVLTASRGGQVRGGVLRPHPHQQLSGAGLSTPIL